MASLETFVEIFKIILFLLHGLPFFVYYKLFVRKNITFDNEENIQGKVVIVTGGSLGMGKASAKEFAQRGATVIIGDVDLKNGQSTVEEITRETGNTNVKLVKLDLSDMDSVENFAKTISAEYPKIKILLNNAGIGGACYENIKTKDGFNKHVAINYMGHFLLTNLLLDNLKAETKSRVVSMSSTVQLLSRLDLDDLNMDKSGFGFENGLPYANTKFCNALFTKELGKRVAGTGITTYALCPGIVNTTIYESCTKQSKKTFELLMKPLGASAEEAASEFIMYCALDKSIENETGKMYRTRRHLWVANRRLNDELAKNLWEKSVKLVKLQERISRMK